MLSECLPIQHSLAKRFVKFANNLLNHDNIVIQSVASISRSNPMSIFNRNCSYVCKEYGYDMQCYNVCKKWYDSITIEEKSNIIALHDMIDVRDGYKECDLSSEEILLTINLICTD